jgi:hypothetical protein
MAVPLKILKGQMLVAHACNPSLSGCRDQEDQGLKPGQANSLRTYLKKLYHKKLGWWNSSR